MLDAYTSLASLLVGVSVLIVVVSVLLVAFVVIFRLVRASRRKTKQVDAYLSVDVVTEQVSDMYQVQPHFVTDTELKFYRSLLTATDADYVICPKVRVADVLRVPSIKHNYGSFLKISQKHVDFLVCDAVTLQPKAAIELHDWTHQSRKRRERDEFLRSAFASAGFPYLEVQVSQMHDVHALKMALTDMLSE